MRGCTVLTTAALLGAATIFPLAGWAQSETFPAPAWTAPETPACESSTAGQLSVQANVQCACRRFAASETRGTPAGYRWDCGILRARNNHEVPETANPYPYPLPPALSLDGAFIVEGRPALPLIRAGCGVQTKKPVPAGPGPRSGGGARRRQPQPTGTSGLAFVRRKTISRIISPEIIEG